MQTPAKEGERFLKAGRLTEVYRPAPKLALTNAPTMAKKCPVPIHGWIMVNENDLAQGVRSLISFGNSGGDDVSG